MSLVASNSGGGDGAAVVDVKVIVASVELPTVGTIRDGEKSSKRGEGGGGGG